MGLGFFIWQRAWESNPLYHKGIHAFQACALPSGPLSIWWKVLESNQRRPLDLYGLANRCIAALPTFQDDGGRGEIRTHDTPEGYSRVRTGCHQPGSATLPFGAAGGTRTPVLALMRGLLHCLSYCGMEPLPGLAPDFRPYKGRTSLSMFQGRLELRLRLALSIPRLPSACPATWAFAAFGGQGENQTRVYAFAERRLVHSATRP